MLIVSQNQPLSFKKLKELGNKSSFKLIKAVVDVSKKIAAIDASLHSDQEAKLLKRGSQQKDLWGINLYPEDYGTDNFIEFDSMINLRPGFGNMSRNVDNPQTREKIKLVINELIKNE